MTTATAVVTLTVAVLAKAHCPAVGVKVKTIAPLNPDGLNKLPDTLDPLQFPVIPLCVVFNPIEEEVLHKFTGGGLLITTATAVVTLTVAVFCKAHCPTVGVKVRTIFPLKPAGLKLLPDTPVPIHIPVTPL